LRAGKEQRASQQWNGASLLRQTLSLHTGLKGGGELGSVKEVERGESHERTSEGEVSKNLIIRVKFSRTIHGDPIREKFGREGAVIPEAEGI